MYEHNSLIYLFLYTIRQHSCLTEEASTDVIYFYNNVPNDTSILEH